MTLEKAKKVLEDLVRRKGLSLDQEAWRLVTLELESRASHNNYPPSGIHLIQEALHLSFGPQCVDYVKGCACCQAWGQLDALIRAQKQRPNAELYRSVSCPRCPAKEGEPCLSAMKAGEPTRHLHFARVQKYVKKAQRAQARKEKR